MKNKKIVLCLIEKIEKNKIVVKYRNTLYNVMANQISDYEVDLFEYFVIGKSYKFCLINNKFLSYKAIRPKLLKNKKYPMPTMSGSKNLEIYLLSLIGKNNKKIVSSKKSPNYNQK